MAKPRHYIFLLAALVVFFGCSGIRFSHLSPEAQDFHPQSMAIFDIGAGGYEEAREAVDRIVTDELTAKGWFQKVLSVQAVQGLFKENEVLRKASADYLAKFNAVNFSDPELSKKISEEARIDALLLVNIDYWYYTKEEGQNVAKVGLGMRMIEAKTGALIWKAMHHLSADYRFSKPELKSVATDVVKQMVGVMPH